MAAKRKRAAPKRKAAQRAARDAPQGIKEAAEEYLTMVFRNLIENMQRVEIEIPGETSEAREAARDRVLQAAAKDLAAWIDNIVEHGMQEAAGMGQTIGAMRARMAMAAKASGKKD